MGFVWKPSKADPWESEVLPALVAFREIHGHLDIQKNFVVPDEAPWPEACRGLKLGSRVKDIRHSGTHLKSSPDRRVRRAWLAVAPPPCLPALSPRLPWRGAPFQCSMMIERRDS